VRISWLLLLLLPAVAFAQLDRAKEDALGRAMADRVNKTSPPLDLPAAQAYVSAIGQRLAAALRDIGASHAPAMFKFSVIAEDLCRETHEPGAFAGGYVFVPAALFAQARDESEFAGMLAHGMAHIALRLGTRTAYQASGKLGNASIPLIYVGGKGGSCAEDVIPRSLMAQLLRNEPEADAMAVRIMARVDYDSAALVSYLTRLQTLENRDGRLAVIDESRAQLPAANYAASTGEFMAVRRQVMEASKPAVLTGRPPTLRRSNESAPIGR